MLKLLELEGINEVNVKVMRIKEENQSDEGKKGDKFKKDDRKSNQKG